MFLAVDALDAKGLAEADKKIEKELGAVTVLVNAAGGNQPAAVVTPENPMTKLSLAAWRENFDLNLVGGALLPCQVFGEGMLKRKKGSIINIASVSAHVPLSKVVAYSAAKAAVINLTQFLAREWAPHGVRVNTITPASSRRNKTGSCSSRMTAPRRNGQSPFLARPRWGGLGSRRNWSAQRCSWPVPGPVVL